MASPSITVPVHRFSLLSFNVMQHSCLLITADFVFYHRNVGFTIDIKIAISADLGLVESTTLETGNTLILLTVRDHTFFCPQTWQGALLLSFSYPLGSNLNGSFCPSSSWGLSWTTKPIWKSSARSWDLEDAAAGLGTKGTKERIVNTLMKMHTDKPK